MELYAFNFVEKPVADYSVPGTLEKEIAYWEKFLTDETKIGTYGTLRDFYMNGFIRAGGVQFSPTEDDRGTGWVEVMVRLADYGSTWYTRYIPSANPETIEKFLEEYELKHAEDQQINWFIKPEVNTLERFY